MATGGWRGLGAALLLVCGVAPASADPGSPLSPVLPVGSWSDFGGINSLSPALARDAAGHALAVWEQCAADASSSVCLRSFDADGTALSPVVTAVQTRGRISLVGDSTVAGNAAGRFVVAWHRTLPALNSRARMQTQAQVFDASASPVTPVLTLGQGLGLSWALADHPLAVDGDGSFTLVWTQWSATLSRQQLLVQRFEPDGTPVAAPRLVDVADNSTESTHLVHANVALDADGDALIVYELLVGTPPGYSQRQIYVRNVSASGTLGARQSVNQQALLQATAPTVAWEPTGDFLVTWADAVNGTTFYGRRYSAGGQALGDQTSLLGVATSLPFGDQFVTMSVAPTGNYVLAGVTQDGLYAQEFAPDDSALGAPLQIAPPGTVTGFQPSVAMDGAGDFGVLWADLQSNIDLQLFSGN